MSIRYKFFGAFSIVVALACGIALYGFGAVSTAGSLVVRLYDGPLMGINHARSAHAALNEARLLVQPGLSDPVAKETVARFEKLNAEIADDLEIVRERVKSADVVAALEQAEGRIRDWSKTGLTVLSPPSGGLRLVPMSFSVVEKSDKAAAALDDLVEMVAGYGFGFRMEAEAAVAANRTTMLALAIGTALVGLLLAITFAYSMSKPIFAAMRIAERVAAGNFNDRIMSSRRDELGRLLNSLAVMQTSLKTRADDDRTMMVKLDAALNNMNLGLCMFGPDNRLVLWNQRYLQMYGIAADCIFVGSIPEEMLAIRNRAGTAFRDPTHYHAKLRALIEKRIPESYTAELVDGRIINVVYQPMQNGGWVATHEDITERKQSEARIAHLALHDPLTDLPNRFAFRERLTKIFADAAPDLRNFAVLCIDLDRFKEVNDVYGHAVGDGYLVEVARRLTIACDGAFVARLGGDEFTIVSSDRSQPAAVEQLCARLSTIFDSPVCINGCDIHGSFTVGVSIYPQDGTDIDTLVTNADAALYKAKAEERGSIRFFEPAMDQQIRAKRGLQRDLALALEKNEFQLYFQPQAKTEGEVVGFEVLVRWRHPVRGLVSPASFIPLAEETGLIGSIDEWVLRAACREAASWPEPLSIAVNLSPMDFRRGDIPAMVLSILLETGLNPQRLEIEITEGVLIDDFERAISILRKIKNLGVRIAMDDFGTGYSSLSYLQSFPFDKIKIDQTFIAKLGKNFQSAAIVRAILGLGTALKLPVLAEGVETEEQRAFLAKEGCTEIQGYLLGRPQPIAHYRHLVATPVTERNLVALAS
jgi:diguanylate cyclase (GGDEF)-like protein